jgi:hypothetical protein
MSSGNPTSSGLRPNVSHHCPMIWFETNCATAEAEVTYVCSWTVRTELPWHSARARFWSAWWAKLPRAWSNAKFLRVGRQRGR